MYIQCILEMLPCYNSWKLLVNVLDMYSCLYLKNIWVVCLLFLILGLFYKVIKCRQHHKRQENFEIVKINQKNFYRQTKNKQGFMYQPTELYKFQISTYDKELYKFERKCCIEMNGRNVEIKKCTNITRNNCTNMITNNNIQSKPFMAETN